MEKLTGYGAPHNHLVGEVGQHYEDLNTGDIYECRIAQKYSPTHGWPVGGYVWELRARGEDIKEIYGSGGQSAGVCLPVVDLTAYTVDMSESTVIDITDEATVATLNQYKDFPSIIINVMITFDGLIESAMNCFLPCWKITDGSGAVMFRYFVIDQEIILTGGASGWGIIVVST